MEWAVSLRVSIVNIVMQTESGEDPRAERRSLDQKGAGAHRAVPRTKVAAAAPWGAARKTRHRCPKRKKVVVGNIYTLRDYSWIEDIVKGVYYATFIKPCDIILSSGKKLSGRDILKYAYNLNKLNFKNFYSVNKIFIRKRENKIVIGSNSLTIDKFKRFNWKPKIYKEKLIKKIYNSI